MSDSFVDWVAQRDLIDLGFAGQKFTWNHGGNVSTRHSSRLDRGQCDGAWKCCFPLASIAHLTHSYLDHCPMLLQLDPGLGQSLGDKPFKFRPCG